MMPANAGLPKVDTAQKLPAAYLSRQWMMDGDD